MEGFTLSTFLTSITSALAELAPENLVTVITTGLGLAVPLILVWFGFRWVYGKVKGALFFGS